MFFFHWSLSDSKSLQVSNTFLSIQADLNNLVGLHRFSRFSGIVPSATITMGITVTFMFHFFSFFLILSQGLDIYLSFHLLLILLCGMPGRQSPIFIRFSFLFIIIIYSFRVFHISVSWWFFTGVWVTASLLKSPGLLSVFWPFLAVLSFR